MSKTDQSSSIDLDEVREKYRLERDKRLNRSKRDIPKIDGDLRRYLNDPYTTPQHREPLFDDVDVVCVGAGFAGLLCGARFRDAGFKNIRLIDSAGDVGGVWYWNRYPEAKCDVESLIYMPLLEELNYVPTMRYATAPEIGEHARRIARHYDLYDKSVFHTTVTGLFWDHDAGRWHVRTDRGDSMRARFVVICIGPMSKVKLPDISGIDTFKGKAFHTSRWDYEYTGGSPDDPNLTGLKDKVVGFIGTGATGLQCVAPLGKSAKQLYVFQRTPSTVGVRNNGPIDSDKVRKFEPGWQRRRQENFTAINAGVPCDVDLIGDGWTNLMGELLASKRYQDLSGEDLVREKELLDFEMMEKIRYRIDQIVKDKETADKLKPYYNYLCKRPGWHDEYLPTFNLPNVTLVDTDGAGVERVYETGLVANGQNYDLDCLIYGTGFETETADILRAGFEVVGRDGVTLAQKWANGVTTLHGITISQFPNFFLVPGLQGQAVVTTNVVHMTQEYVEHIAYIAKTVRDNTMDFFELTVDAEAEWVQTIIDRSVDRTAFLEACTPGRYNYEGKLKARPIQNRTFDGGPLEYFSILKAWRETGSLPGLKLSKANETQLA